MRIQAYEARRRQFEGLPEIPLTEAEIEAKAAAVYETDVWEMDLSVRAKNCLYRAKCKTLGETIEYIKTNDLLRLRHMGPATAREIVNKIKELTGQDYTDEVFPPKN